MRVTARLLLTAAVAVSLAVAGPAWGLDVPLKNWEVPRSPTADLDNPGAFVPVTPCRIADTRGANGAYGGPALVANVARSFDIDSSPTCTGIPSPATAYSLNFTIIGSAGAYQNAFLTVWPTGATQPTVSTLNFDGGQLKANAAIVPRGTNGAISVFVNAAAHLLIDINGYFTNDPSDNGQFFINGNFAGGAAIVGFNYSNTNGSHGVGGYANGTGIVHGVQGEIGTSPAAGSSGVHGIGAATTRVTFAIFGENNNSTTDSAGVLGRVTAGTPPVINNLAAAAGVRGEGEYRGVNGVAGPNGVGVRGFSLNSAGIIQTSGSLGQSTTYGVYADGNMGATGTKTFVEPHPYKAGAVIRYVALEGPEAGTYFRGRGQFVGGKAVIEVPESFRLVTDPEGITVQVTPIGRATAVGVVRIGLDVIEVEAIRDVEFSYLVQGVRRTFKDWQVEVVSDEFMPELPTQTIPNYLSERQKRNLIESGVYNEDGTVNMETAERLG
ncbi:hypothetical protein FBQ97_19530, partial [Acidobacteria bacterium ACD]|nr:hypothetical protein [Acidobacteria bacterium ACD]